MPLYWSGIAVTRSRCITDRIEGANRAFPFRFGCSRIIADAPVIKRQLIELNGIPPEKIDVIGSAVDLTRFHPHRDATKFREELGISAEVPLVVNIGMIRPDKGQLTLVEAAKLVLMERPETRFAFIGEGTGSRKLGPRLREAIARSGLGKRLLMLGYRWDIPDILAACDLAVIASIGTEASPIVLRETLACGRPIVATRVGDIAEVIRDREHGLLVPPRAPEEMAAAILKLLSNRELANYCAENGLRLARAKFSFEQMMQEKLRVDAEIATKAPAVRSRLRRRFAQ